MRVRTHAVNLLFKPSLFRGKDCINQSRLSGVYCDCTEVIYRETLLRLLVLKIVLAMFVLVTTNHESGDNEVVCPSTEITNIFKPPNTKTTEPWYGCE